MVKRWFHRKGLKPETSVATSRQVLSGSRVVTVVHQNDGTWQFMCDQPKLSTDMRIVHFQDIIDLDSTVLQFVGLAKGGVAIVDDGGVWRHLYFETDTEIDEWLGAVGPPEHS